MTAQETIARVEAKHKSVSGYSYDAEEIARIVEAGYAGIPDGATVASQGNQKIVKRGDECDCVIDGKVVKTSPVSSDAQRDAMLVEYAYSHSHRGHAMGRM